MKAREIRVRDKEIEARKEGEAVRRGITELATIWCPYDRLFAYRFFSGRIQEVLGLRRF